MKHLLCTVQIHARSANLLAKYTVGAQVDCLLLRLLLTVGGEHKAGFHPLLIDTHCVLKEYTGYY